MAAGALSFSLMSALAKLAGRAVPVFEIVLARSVVVAILSGASVARAHVAWRGREPGLLLLRGLLGLGALTCVYYAVVHLPLADATVLQFTNPVWTALAATLFLGEMMAPREALLAAASLGGVVMVARPTFLFGHASALDPVAVGVGLLGALLTGVAYMLVRRLREEAPMLIVFWFAAVSVVVSLPLVVFHPVAPSLGTAAVLLGVGLTAHGGQVLTTWAFRLEPAGRTSAVGYLQIVFAAGWGLLLFHEVPDAWTWAGAAVVVGSTLILVRSRPRIRVRS
jgi:drug/metabolite transporter (DMT)-like permease